MTQQYGFSEAQWEFVALDTLAQEKWKPLKGTGIAPGTGNGRESWDDIVLPGRMLSKLRQLNPQVPPEYLEQALGDIIQRPEAFDISEADLDREVVAAERARLMSNGTEQKLPQDEEAV